MLCRPSASRGFLYSLNALTSAAFNPFFLSMVGSLLSGRAVHATERYADGERLYVTNATCETGVRRRAVAREAAICFSRFPEGPSGQGFG